MPPKGPRFVKPQKEVFDEKYSFYSFVRWILCLCWYTGLLTISGLRHKSSELTRCSSKSWYSTAYWVTLVLQGMRFILFTVDTFLTTNRIELMYKSANVFIIMAHYCTMLFMMRFSLRWELFVKQVESIEKLLPSTNHSRTLTFSQYLIVTMLVLAAADFFLLHILIWNIVKNCAISSGGQVDFETFCKMVYSNIFQHLAFSSIWLPFILFLHIQLFLLWNYIDIFIMVVSIYLSCKFQDFNKLILQKKQSDSARGVASWSTLQVYYTRMSRLVTLIDENISPAILISYFSNLFFIVRQIFYVTRSNADTIIYFMFTCSFAILRTGLISYFASNLHLESREPLQALHTFPSSAFNTDMERLMTQVYYSKVSLTGCSFFGITRSMILAMVGTLITYELVLFQI